MRNPNPRKRKKTWIAMRETRQVDKPRDSGYQINVYIIIIIVIITSDYMWRVVIRRLGLFGSRELTRKNERILRISEFGRIVYRLVGLGENNGKLHRQKIE